MATKRIKFFHTIRFRVSLVVAVMIFVAVLASSTFNALQSFDREVSSHRAAIAGAGSAYVAAIADPVASDDRHAALSVLRGIRELPNILQADITRADGSTFAQLGTGASLVRQNGDALGLSDQQLWQTRNLRIELPIVKGGEEIGTLGLLSDLSGMRQAVISSLIATSISALLAILIGIAAAQFFIARMTDPLQKLTSLMANFQNENSLKLPVLTSRRDETGILTEAFADMIESIQERDRRIALHMETLEDTVETRTRDLRIARDDAEAANAAKSDFLATMSHEIRTPMNGMLVMAEMLSAADLSTRHRRYADIISRSGNSLLTIINDILDLSKIESGHLELEAIPVSPEALVTDVVSLFWERARESNLQLAAYVSPRVPREISADPTRLNQIITNLVNNALKFTETGGVLIEVDCVPNADRSNVGLIVSVRDTGIGIPDDKIEHIFEAFSQADQSTTRQFGGTGLGLSVCRKLVVAMGGQIKVESTQGYGSVFTLTVDVPVAKPATAVVPSALRVQVDLPDGIEKRALVRRLTDHGCQINQPESDVRILKSSALFDQDEDGAIASVVLSDIGDTQADNLLQSGKAVDCIPNPYTRSDILTFLESASVGSFRGVSALQASSTRLELATFEGLRILAADDNAVNREVLREALSTLKVEAVFAEDGEQAVRLAESDGFDLIFMDGSMPVMDGFEATRKIREAEGRRNAPRTPIYALTAQVARRDASDWTEAGADGHISKPFSLEKLSETFSGLGREPQIEPETKPRESIVETQLFDPTTLATLDALGGSSGRNVRARIWKMFQEKAPMLMIELDALVSSGPLTDISQKAHAIKSMALSAGAAAFANRLAMLEAGALDGDSRQALSVNADQARCELDDTLAAMADQLNTSSIEAA